MDSPRFQRARGPFACGFSLFFFFCPSSSFTNGASNRRGVVAEKCLRANDLFFLILLFGDKRRFTSLKSFFLLLRF